MPTPIPVFIEGTDYVMESATLSTRAQTNIRPEHNTTLDPVIQLNRGDFFPCLISGKPLWTGSGNMWFRVKDGNKILWVADTDNLIRDRTSKPDVPDTPDDLPDAIGLPEIEDMVQQVLAPLMETLLIDVPLPDFTMSIPALMKDYLVSYHRAQSKMHEAIARRIESGTPTASQIADEIYATVELDDVHATSLSGLSASTQLDVLNGTPDGK